ncbi:hypothetical protein GDO78_022445 [Eleutherodactylus coqui]|uniref:Uncharacterized protein n=1 Tax=Eleutherodactylus coqui TaxID=57060 RepID=A0A8J6B2U3_ELECQ|nr:hypothetical protein GDO78_022445 [Eleutherodactylus coqui]
MSLPIPPLPWAPLLPAHHRSSAPAAPDSSAPPTCHRAQELYGATGSPELLCMKRGSQLEVECGGCYDGAPCTLKERSALRSWVS